MAVVQPGDDFEGIKNPRRVQVRRFGKMNFQTLERELSERVIEPFTQASGTVAIVVKVGLPGLEQDEDVPPNPGHPLCAKEAGSDYCRESWQLHLAELRSRPKTHMHRCKYGRLCAVVPVVCHGRCIGAMKLVRPPKESETRFAHLVGVLDALVRDYVAKEGDSLKQLGSDGPPKETHLVPFTAGSGVIEGNQITALIGQAIRYVEENLSDPNLTVQHVAEALGVSPNYLSHCFSNHVGGRLGRFIVDERVKRAEKLLVTTDWQIKHIAHETGYANPNWFSHVFHARTGVTPREYRARTQRSIA